MSYHQLSNIGNKSIYALSRAPAIFHVTYKLNSRQHRTAMQVRDVGISISFMNCKLTDFSVLNLKLLLFTHLIIIK